ncbi:hypothetical protein EW145_g1555 [Phellinidium pouzarii]|uniref:Uncharacterized protein n=1 Tax=Phellinidium pouzarii TaxID=167371 RepID=A0A4V3XDK4_9AGAM|nr:hypothetical protein EW145_g1555 [Phellinidium pouzarii]
MNAQPSAMRRISHHARCELDFSTTVGVLMPVMLGKDAVALIVPDAESCGIATRSLRHAPSPLTTEVPLSQAAVMHDPERSTLLPSAQLRQLELPDALQLPQELSQLVHPPVEESKNSVLLHVGRHRPDESTGLADAHDEHWLKEAPEQVAQSGWQGTHAPEEENEFGGQEKTHEPIEARRLFEQVKQKVDEPAHVPQDESQAEHDTLSLGSKNVPLGQLSMHWPLLRTNPGRHAEHFA